MSYSYDRNRQRRALPVGPSNRSVVGYWVPLIVTVTAATIAIGAWVWSERRDSDEGEFPPGESEDAAYARRLKEERRAVSGSRGEEEFFEVGPGGILVDKQGRQIDLTDDEGQERGVTGQNTFMSRMSDVIRRTPSPQQIYDGASRRMAAGVAAVGRSLRSISEENKDDFVDHEMWSEEAESKDRAEDARAAVVPAVTPTVIEPTPAAPSSAAPRSQPAGRKRLVAVVVSAAEGFGAPEGDVDSSYHIEHASILSHLINRVDPDAVELLVLIYAPHLKSHPLSSSRRRPSSSAESSYSNISNREAEAFEEYNPASEAFDALNTQATALTSHPTHVMPFTTPTGHVHILRHIAPSLVYIQDSLSGDDGTYVKQIEDWVGQIVVVVGADVGAGLVDTETEDEGNGNGHKGRKDQKQWWQDESRVGLGKGVEVVDGDRIGDDWTKRLAQ